MKIGLYNEFPRVIGYPVRLKLINNIEELNEYIKENISKYDLHLSLYTFSTLVRENGVLKPDYQSARVNKIYWDLDEGYYWIKNMQELHRWCMEKDILHRFHLSSDKGGHFFIACKPQIRYKKSALYNFQMYICKKFDITVNKSISVFGDIARSFRISNTFNFKRQKYCVAINENELNMIEGVDDPILSKLTEKPRKESNNDLWYGTKLVNLSAFDKKRYLYEDRTDVGEINISKLLSNEELKKLKLPIKSFPPCIQHLMNLDYLGHFGRNLLTYYLRDQKLLPLTNKEILSIIKNVLSQEEWLHCATNRQLSSHNPGEELKPIRTILSGKYKTPSCSQILAKNKNRIYCPKYDECGRWHPIFK